MVLYCFTYRCVFVCSEFLHKIEELLLNEGMKSFINYFIYGYMALGMWNTSSELARCTSVVERSLMVRWVVGLIIHGGPIELFLVPANAPRLV